MKKIIPLLVALALGISACQKDEMPEPSQKDSLKLLDKNLECNCGGGSWDLEGTDEPTEPSALRVVSSESEPVPAEKDKSKKEKPAKPEKTPNPNKPVSPGKSGK